MKILSRVQYVFFNVLLMLMVTGVLQAQSNANITAQVGEGIRFKTENDAFYLKLTTRIQTRWDFNNDLGSSYTDEEGVYHADPETSFENKAFVKRSRLKFDGYFLNKNLVYKIEYDVAGGYVRDALFKYKMKNLELWFGQGKLPGNRERVVSSANLQMVDRSIFNKYYTLDRDAGIQIHHKIPLGKSLLYNRWAVSSGSGIKDNDFAPGVSLTGKLEFLPFGKFKSKGDYKSADLAREETAKFAIACYTNYNIDSYKDRGQVGNSIGGEADLLNVGGDFVLKYKGYSLMVEAAKRSVTDDNEFIYDGNDIVGAYYTGYGANIQTGYVFKNNWEVSGRYAFTKPDEKMFHSEMTDYTFGISKYIIGHNFKFQGDVTLRDKAYGQNQLITRFQMEFQF